MKIGYDAKRAVRNMTGLGNYSRLVIEKYAIENPDDSLLMYTPEMRDNPRLAAIRRLPNVEFRLPPAQGFKGGLWRSFGITNNLIADKIDIFHGLSNELPLNIRHSGIPSVLTIHDVIYRRLPECYKPIDRLTYNFKYGRSCNNADRIIAVSERTKKDIVEFYGIDPDKIDVVYQGCDNIFRLPADPVGEREIRARLSLPERYIIQVGTIEKRKNLELTVKALSALDPTVHLVVVGRDHHGYKKYVRHIADQLGVTDRIHYYESLAFADLPPLYRMAEAASYPSRYEGFGIPVIEALECQTPVVAATGSCLEEAGGPGAIYVSPDSPEEMAGALRAIVNRETDVEKMKAEGKKHIARFDTAGMASAIQEVYAKTLAGFKR